MFDEFPEVSSSAQIPSALPQRRNGALGPKLIMAVFVVALAFDVLARVAGHFALRALKRHQPRRIFPHAA